MNDTEPTPITTSPLSTSVAEHLYQRGHLPVGSFVDSFLVCVRVVAVDGGVEAVWFHSRGFGPDGQVELLDRVRAGIDPN